MNRRNFFKGLFGVAIVAMARPLMPLAKEPFPIPSYDPRDVKAFMSNTTPFMDALCSNEYLTISTVRRCEALLTENAVPFRGQHYECVIFDDLC